MIPQIIAVILLSIAVGDALVKKSELEFYQTATGSLVWIGVLYWGGFFGG